MYRYVYNWITLLSTCNIINLLYFNQKKKNSRTQTALSTVEITSMYKENARRGMGRHERSSMLDVVSNVWNHVSVLFTVCVGTVGMNEARREKFRQRGHTSAECRLCHPVQHLACLQGDRALQLTWELWLSAHFFSVAPHGLGELLFPN